MLTFAVKGGSPCRVKAVDTGFAAISLAATRVASLVPLGRNNWSDDSLSSVGWLGELNVIEQRCDEGEQEERQAQHQD